MQIKKEYIILALLAVVLFLYLVFHNSGKINYTLPEIKKTETGDYSQIIMEKGGSSITINRDNDLWYLADSGMRAEKGAVDDILNGLSELDITDLVAKTGSLKAYGLADPDVIHVTAKDKGNTVLRNLYIGKLTTGGSFTYIKLENDKNIYTARGRLPDSFDKTEDQLADRKVLSFESSSVLKINIEADSSKTTFTKQEKDGKEIWKDKSGNTIDSKMVLDNLSALNQLKFNAYAEKKPEAAVATLELSDKEGIHTLALSPKTETGYIGTSSYVEKPFVIDVKTGDAIMKAFDELSGKPDSK